MNFVYDLAHILDLNIENIFKKESLENYNYLPLKIKNWVSNDGKYSIMQYVKDQLNGDDKKKYSIYRSVVFDKDRVYAFSPPKSVQIDKFISIYAANECYVEQFIEGTMINLFFGKKDWEISTKSTVGGNVSFFKDQPQFRTLFFEICKERNIDFTKLDKDLSYSFVMQHKKNRIVLPITENMLFLIAVYKINGFLVNCLNNECRNKIAYDLGVNIPQLIYDKLFDLELLKDEFCSINTPYYIPAITIYHRDGTRSKIVNPNYDYIKKLRGNSPKLQYQYLNLRKNNHVREFLKYFPEKRIQFSKMRKQIHDFTYNLHAAYLECYVNKSQAHSDFPYQYKPHMYKLHKQYIDNIGTGYIISYNEVINYVNNLHPAQLMYSLNYVVNNVIKDDETMDINE